MKKIIATICLAVSALALSAQTKVTFTAQWSPQAQFAGYYIAYAKGFYKAEGLDVEIKHPGVNSTESIISLLFNGKSDFVGQQIINGIINRSDGLPVFNVLQLTQKSGLWCVSREPISNPDDLDGLKVGRWKVGFGEFCDMMELSRGISINWIPFLKGINLYVFGAVDATLCYSYSEFVALELAMGEIPEENILKFSDFGYNCPEDGLYVSEAFYNKHKDVVEKFVRATKKGWDYARDHFDEALDLSMKYVKRANIVTNRTHQQKMLEEYLDLMVNPATGNMDYAPIDKSTFGELTNALLNTGYITKAPDYNEIIK